jgi:hypothetical protein
MMANFSGALVRTYCSPSDATKTAPGACGCGVADADADGDWNPDCTDGWYVVCRVWPA